MAKVQYVGKDTVKRKIEQGDYVYCEADPGSGAYSFWGIYSESVGSVISLNGGGTKYIQGKNIYSHVEYGAWTITKVIPDSRVVITIDEII